MCHGGLRVWRCHDVPHVEGHHEWLARYHVGEEGANPGATHGGREEKYACKLRVTVRGDMLSSSPATFASQWH